eukprot:gene8232-8422_t
MSAGSLTTPSKQTPGISTSVLRTNGALSQQQQQVVRGLSSTAAPAGAYAEAADTTPDGATVKAHYPPLPAHSTATTSSTTGQLPASTAVGAGSPALPLTTGFNIGNSSRSLGSDDSSSSSPTVSGMPSAGSQFKVATDRPASVAADAAGSAVTAASRGASGSSMGVPGVASTASKRLPHPAALLVNQHSDRTVMFLVTLVTYPFMFLLMQTAADAGTKGLAGVGGGSIDTRQRLSDFPEGAALADLESWCMESLYTSWWQELLIKGLRLVRSLLLQYLPYDIVRQVLYHPQVLQLLQMQTAPPLTQLVDEFLPTAKQMMRDGSPHRIVLPSIDNMRQVLEQRHRLSRGPTPLERLDFITHISRTASFLFFGWLRALARLCTYISGMLSVVSGALSFTVVPSIILSVLSAGVGIIQLLLTGTADLLEPAVNGVLALTETGKDKAVSLTAGGSPVGSRQLPPATVEQLETFFDKQLAQVSGLLNRPEIPRLAGLNKPLLVKAYDLGLVDALGRTEGRPVRQLLEAAQAEGTLHILLRGTYSAVAAASAWDVFGLVNSVSDTLRRLSTTLLPGPLGGQRSSVKGLFRSDGFFAYADEREAQVALVLLSRLLSWLHLASVVAPGSADCLRYVLLLGEAQSGKNSLFSQLVAAPSEYAAQLGGVSAAGERSLSSKVPGTAAAPNSGAGGLTGAPAVDVRLVAGQRNMYCCVFPGLNSADLSVSTLSKGLAMAMGGLASAVVFLVHPSSEPSPEKLVLLEGALAAGRRCLVAINGPSRQPRLLQGVAAPPASLAGNGDWTDTGFALSSPQTPLEELRLAWQSAAETFCAGRGISPSLLGVVVSELQDNEDGATLPPGVHKFKQESRFGLDLGVQYLQMYAGILVDFHGEWVMHSLDG